MLAITFFVCRIQTMKPTRENPDAYRRDDPDRKFLQSRYWRDTIRPMQLARSPLCEHCKLLGIVRPALHVDHILRPRGHRTLQTDWTNLQSLCPEHHLRKSNWERSRHRSSKPLVVGVTLAGELVLAPHSEKNK